MIAFILAAGFGTRLRPLTHHTPKALVPYGGQPLLAHKLAWLKQQGFQILGANCHHLADQVRHFQQQSPLPFTLFEENGEIRDTGGALYFARDFLRRQDVFLTANVDILVQTDLRTVIQQFLKSQTLAALLAQPGGQDGSLWYHPENHLLQGDRRSGPKPADCLGAHFIGHALYRKEFLDLLTPEDRCIKKVWYRAIAAGHQIRVTLLQDSSWHDVGTPNDLAVAHFKLLEQGRAFPGYHFDPWTECMYPHGLPSSMRTYLKRHVWCGPNVTIGTNAVIEDAVLLPGAIVKEGATINHALVFRHEVLHLDR